VQSEAVNDAEPAVVCTECRLVSSRSEAVIEQDETVVRRLSGGPSVLMCAAGESSEALLATVLRLRTRRRALSAVIEQDDAVVHRFFGAPVKVM